MAARGRRARGGAGGGGSATDPDESSPFRDNAVSRLSFTVGLVDTYTNLPLRKEGRQTVKYEHDKRGVMQVDVDHKLECQVADYLFFETCKATCRYDKRSGVPDVMRLPIYHAWNSSKRYHVDTHNLNNTEQTLNILKGSAFKEWIRLHRTTGRSKSDTLRDLLDQYFNNYAKLGMEDGPYRRTRSKRAALRRMTEEVRGAVDPVCDAIETRARRIADTKTLSEEYTAKLEDFTGDLRDMVKLWHLDDI